MVSCHAGFLLWLFKLLFSFCRTDTYSDQPKLNKIGILIEDNLLGNIYCPNKMENLTHCASISWHIGEIQLEYRTLYTRDLPRMKQLVNEMKAENINGIVSFAMCDSHQILHQILTENEIPYLPVPSTYCYHHESSRNGRSPWRLRHRASHLITAILSVIIEMKSLLLKEVIIFMDGTFGVDQTSALLLGLSEENIRFLSFQVNYTSANYEKELKKNSFNVERTFYLLLTYGKGAYRILKSAKEIELIRFNTIWVLGNLDTNLDDLNSLGFDKLFVNAVLFKKPCVPPTATLDTNQLGWKMSMADGLLLETVSRYLSDCLNVTKTEFYPPEAWQTELFFPVNELYKEGDDVRRVLLDPEQNLDERYDIFRLDFGGTNSGKSKGGNIDFRQVGEWCIGFGLSLLTKDVLPNVLAGLGNQTLKIGGISISPYVIKTVEDNETKWTGFCIDLLEQLSIDMNFNYEFIEPEDKMIGSFDNTTGNWTGIIRQAMKNEIEIGIGPITLTAERFSVIDYTYPFTEDGIGFVMKRLVDDGMALDMIFRPFEATIWFLLPCVILLTGVVLTFVNRMSARIRGGKPETDINCSFYQNIWFMFGTTVHQAQSNEPKNISARLIIVFWWIFVILLSTYYTAFLAAFLTVNISQSRINSLKDLTFDESIYPITLAGSTWWSYFLKSDEPDVRQIGIAIQRSRNETEISTIMEMVRTGDYAFVMDSSIAAYFAGSDPDFLSYVVEEGYKHSLGFVTPKGSRIRELLSFNIIKLQESGFIAKLRSQWWNATQHTVVRKYVNQEGLSLNDLGGAFIVFISAACLGVFLSIVETVTLCYRRKKTFDTKKQSIIRKSSKMDSVSLQNFVSRLEKT